MNCFRFANVLINTTTINIFNSDSNIANIKTQHCQTMATNADEILKFDPMIKKPIVTNYLLLLLLAKSIPSLI